MTENTKTNRERRQQLELERAEEQAKIKRGLLSIVDDAAASPGEKLKAAEMLRKYFFVV